MNRNAPRRGFTLIELMIVVAILGIIIAIVAFNLINAIERARQRRTMGDMHAIAVAIETYATDHNRYPPSSSFALPSGLSLPTTTIGGAANYLQPTYMKSVPLVDGWRSWYTYGVTTEGTDYVLRSGGRDGTFEASPAYGKTTNFNSDLIFVDGSFVQWPEGVQE